jgi:signal transduction histidine kinase
VTRKWPVPWKRAPGRDAAWGLLAAVLFTAVATRETAVSTDLAGPLWANALCAAAMAAPMVAGRRHPCPTAMLALAGAMAQTTWLTPSTRLAMPLLGVLVAAFVAGRYVTARTTALALLALTLAVEWAGPIAVNGDPLEDALFVNIAMWAVWLLGRSRLAGERFAREEAARSRAEREREAQIRAAVTGERRAIARDLHDTVAHAVTLMVLQATGTRLIARTQPEAVEPALGSIEKAGREAMDDLRAMLRVLRRDDDQRDDQDDSGSDSGAHGDGDAGTPAAPGPGLGDVTALVESARAGGIDATLEPLPDEDGHSPSSTAAAYRTVQEGLTNAARHAPGSEVHVAVRATGRLLTVSVDNGPCRKPQPSLVQGTGTGLIGLRERVTALDGTMNASPRADGGFTLSIELPRNLP